jgi:pSer/pThr/pTyr-binding forkhead associated (FHA) protein
MRRHHKNNDDEVAVKSGSDEEFSQATTGSKAGASWKCLACGAFNDDSEQVCSECTAKREGAEATPKKEQITEADILNWEAPAEEKAASAEPDEANIDTDLPEEPQLEEPKIEPDEEFSPPVVSSPIEAPATPSPSPTPSFTPSYTSTQATGGTRYYLVFVNSPAQSIIKSKVAIDFEEFPTISIGRNPENVVVVPDQEVSRKHAELSLEGGKIIVRDLNSKNGTYVYNGKQFERVSDSAEVKLNSLLKFGTGTIVRLTVG